MPHPWDDILREDYATEAEPSSTELNTVGKVLDAQVEGALEGIGVGCLGPADCVVTAGVGLTVEIASPRANVQTSVGVVYVEATSTYVLTVPANQAAVYIYIGAKIRVAPTDPDSREGTGPLYDDNLVGGEVENYLLLAHCATNGTGIVLDSVVDDRTFVAGQQAIADLGGLQAGIDAAEAGVTEVQDALGTHYFVAGEPTDPSTATVTTRLTDLESGGGGVVYWRPLKKTASDDTTIEEEIAAAVGAGGGVGGGGGGSAVVQVPDAVSVANHLRLGLRLIHALPEVEETQKWAFYFVPGISAATLYDAVLTTATVNLVNHTIGP